MKKVFNVKNLKVRSFYKGSELPPTVYVAVVVALATALALSVFHSELSLNLFTELLGAAFTLFIIGELLVRSKTKRWKVVREHIDYLISRDVNRIRDGVATRVFYFDPDIEQGISEQEQLFLVQEQRSLFLAQLELLSPEQIQLKLRQAELFKQDSYSYFHEKADDIWNILNMKYSEYLDPELVSCLIELHTNLKDVCGHIRQYLKGERFPQDKDYYRATGAKGVAVSLKKVLRVLNLLKEKGYSVAADLSEGNGQTENTEDEIN